MQKKGERKVRSDKKRDVKPYISLDLKDAIYRISYITSTPVKDVCDSLCFHSINSPEIIESLSQYFKRKIRINNTLYIGDIENPKISTKNLFVKTGRVSMRLSREMYEFVHSLSYSLDTTVGTTTSILLEKGMNDISFVNYYINTYLTETMDERRKRELQKILDYMNRELNEKHTLSSLLSYIVDEFKKPMESTKDAVGNFISDWKKK